MGEFGEVQTVPLFYGMRAASGLLAGEADMPSAEAEAAAGITIEA
ncbi:hypothetical protein PQR05_21430 [Paraburkholderia sediminicola]